jgi:hypothetical protein
MTVLELLFHDSCNPCHDPVHDFAARKEQNVICKDPGVLQLPQNIQVN